MSPTPASSSSSHTAREFLAYAEALAASLADLQASAPRVRVVDASTAAFVSCGQRHEHFVPARALGSHLVRRLLVCITARNVALTMRKSVAFSGTAPISQRPLPATPVRRARGRSEVELSPCDPQSQTDNIVGCPVPIPTPIQQQCHSVWIKAVFCWGSAAVRAFETQD